MSNEIKAELICQGRVDGQWVSLTHCLDKRDHDRHDAERARVSAEPEGDPA